MELDTQKLLELAQSGNSFALLVVTYLLIKACERLARIEKALDHYMKEDEDNGSDETQKEGGRIPRQRAGNRGPNT